MIRKGIIQTVTIMTMLGAQGTTHAMLKEFSGPRQLQQSHICQLISNLLKGVPNPDYSTLYNPSADVNEEGENGETLLHTLCGMCNPCQLHLDIMTLLLKHPLIQIDATTSNIELLDRRLRDANGTPQNHGNPLRTKEINDITPLMVAVKTASQCPDNPIIFEMICALVNAGAHPRAEQTVVITQQGCSPLNHAVPIQQLCSAHVYNFLQDCVAQRDKAAQLLQH